MSSLAANLPKLPAAHAKRLAWALKAHGHLLAAAVKQDTSLEAREIERLPDDQAAEGLARLILERADPTASKSMTGWLVRQYAQGGFRLEDTGTARETLEMFQRHAPKLSEGQRDLGKYPGLAEVWDSVIQIAEAEREKISGKAQKALDRDRAYAESRILGQDEDGFTIAVPLTEFAAKWWGRGTRWCTAAEQDNQFWHYHQQAPLIVMVIPELKEKGKFQLWFTGNSDQFSNARDRSPSQKILHRYRRHFIPLFSIVLGQNGNLLKYIPNPLRSPQICEAAVKQNGNALKHVPLEQRTKEICEFAIKQSVSALEFSPENSLTKELCKVAVEKEALLLRYVPYTLRSPEICGIAVKQDGQALRYVPTDLRTEGLCKIAAEQAGMALGHIPEDRRTPELCRIAVAQSGLALAHIPKHLRTKELCSMAVAQYGGALRYVPEALRSEKMCRIAVAHSGNALQHVPEKIRTEALFRIAVLQNWEALRWVRHDLRTEELCKIAVAQNGRALQLVPDVLFNEELCRISVTQDGQALWEVPEGLSETVRQSLSHPKLAWHTTLLDELADLLQANSQTERMKPTHV
jgi:hypothetical protein